MPTTPELGDILRQVRLLEIHHEVNPQEFAYTARYAAVSGEITVNLNGKQIQ